MKKDKASNKKEEGEKKRGAKEETCGPKATVRDGEGSDEQRVIHV